MRGILTLLWCCVWVTAFSDTTRGTIDVTLDVDWSSFLGRADLLWDWQAGATPAQSPPVKWYHSAFMGNGALGLMVRAGDTECKTLRIDVGNSAIWDDREPNTTYASDNNFVCDRPRLPLGHFIATFNETVTRLQMRLVLWDAQTTGTVHTNSGVVHFTALVNARYDTGADVGVVTFHPTGGASMPDVKWVAEPADSTWAHRCKNYKYNPPPVTTVSSDGISVCTQPHLSKKNHATAWKLVDGVLTVGVGNVSMHGEQDALAKVRSALQQGVPHMVGLHQAWWHAYYPSSFLTIRPTKMESFYWINMYKLASGTRSDRVVYDLMGPWFIDGTVWPDLHWDLNVQLTYWPLYTANRLSLVESLTHLLSDYTPELIGNVMPAYRGDSAAAPSGASSLECRETCYWNHGTDCLITPPTVTGNLMWAMQLWHQLYEYTGDTKHLKDLYPLLRRSVQFYIHYQTNKSSDHFVHLPPTMSPEYGSAPDCNYDLALYRWGLTALIDAANILQIHDKGLPLWEATLKSLVPYPAGKDGYWIGAGVPLAHGHRHFSHLFMIFPLRTLNFTDPSNVNIAERSIDHWLGMTQGLTGFCRTAASSMNVILGRRSSAYTNLTYLLDSYILPNTFYHEGENGECGETPPAASSSIQDWLLMRWDNNINIFAGIHDQDITDAAFYRLRAPGGFLVSAVRNSSRTSFVQVESRSPIGAPLQLAGLASLDPPLHYSPTSASVKVHQDGTVVVSLPKGGVVLLYTGPEPPTDLVIRPSAGIPKEYNAWGVHPTPSPASGSIELAACTGNADQVWDWTPGSDTKGTPIQLRSQPTKCLAAKSCNPQDGVALGLAACDAPHQCPGGANQLWYRDAHSSLQCAGGGLCIDVNSPTSPLPRPVDLWHCNDGAKYHNTQWVYNTTDGTIRSMDPLQGPLKCLSRTS